MPNVLAEKENVAGVEARPALKSRHVPTLVLQLAVDHVARLCIHRHQVGEGSARVLTPLGRAVLLHHDEHLVKAPNHMRSVLVVPMVAAKHGGVVERESKPTVHLGDDLRTPALFGPLQRLGVWAFSKGEAFQPTEAAPQRRVAVGVFDDPLDFLSRQACDGEPLAPEAAHDLWGSVGRRSEHLHAGEIAYRARGT